MKALKSSEFLSQVPMNKRELLNERAKKAQSPTGPGYVTFQDFVNVVSGLNSSLKRFSRPVQDNNILSICQNKLSRDAAKQIQSQS